VTRALRMKKQKDGSRRAGEPLEMAGEESAPLVSREGWSEPAEAAGNVERRRRRMAMGKEGQRRARNRETRDHSSPS